MKFCVFLMIQNIVILIMNIKTGYFLVIQSATLSADLLLRKFIVVVIVFFLHIFFCLQMFVCRFYSGSTTRWESQCVSNCMRGDLTGLDLSHKKITNCNCSVNKLKA